MGYIMEAAQRAAALIRNALGGGSAPAAQAPSKPTLAYPQAKPAAPPAAATTGDARRNLAENAVRQHRELFVALFSEAGGKVRGTVPGSALDQAFKAGKGGNLSPHAFRMLVVGSGIGTCPADGIALTEMGSAVIRDQLAKPAATIH